MPADKKPDDKEQAAAAAAQAALDKEAADRQARADAEAKRLADLEADAQKAEEKAEDYGQPRAARCPDPACRERLERYQGDNPHKQGTHFCPVHGRIRLG